MEERMAMDEGRIHPLGALPDLLAMKSQAKSARRQTIVISGPSGVGKGTLIQMLSDAHPGLFASTVSHTTRKPRPGEVEGKHYFFVSVPKFSTLLSQGAFVEHTVYNGHHYGTSHKTIEDQLGKGLRVILDIEMSGVKQMKSNPEIKALYVFIKPPSIEALESRLRARGTEKEADIQRRLEQAVKEIDSAEQSGNHDKIITNSDLSTAFNELDAYVME